MKNKLQEIVVNVYSGQSNEQTEKQLLEVIQDNQKLINRMINYLSSVDYLEGQDKDMDEMIKLLGIKCQYNDLNETFWTE